MFNIEMRDKYSDPIIQPEYNSGESDVDIALYKTTEQRIDEYIRAGENLEDQRRLQYHTDYLEKMKLDSNWTDPLLYRGLDRIELELMHQEAINEILERLKESDFSTSPQPKAESMPAEAVDPVGKSEDSSDKPESGNASKAEA